ncbi:MAG: FxsA family protein [Candidatus Omnitrophica bacterium]|nr:FxsA family protein [Candidatus Omnitrophota bacterium]
MMPLILLFLISLPVLELYVLIKVGSHIGALNTIMLLVVSAVVGSAIARFEGYRVMIRMQEELAKGNSPNSEVLDGVLILTAGILLIVPGFITDIFGLILLFPWTRSLVKMLIKWQIKRYTAQGRFVDLSYPRRQNDDDEVIDV